MFEKHRPPAVFMAKNAVLSSFATGRQTSVVVDIGHEGTTGAAQRIVEQVSARYGFSSSVAALSASTL